MFHGPSKDSNLKTKGLALAASLADQCFQPAEIWLPTLDTFRNYCRPIGTVTEPMNA
jgi:hypothetical protein